MNSAQNIPEHQKKEFMQYLEDEQLKDSLKMYNYVVENCFDKCVSAGAGWTGTGPSMRSKQLEETEAKCVSNCAEKFMKMTQRVGFRFGEYQAQQMNQPNP